MFSGRPRASDTAGRASPTFVRSGNSFFAKIFVFLAFSVQGGLAFSLGSSDARATGGTITTFGDYVIHTFMSSGTFEVTDSTLTEVDARWWWEAAAAVQEAPIHMAAAAAVGGRSFRPAG